MKSVLRDTLKKDEVNKYANYSQKDFIKMIKKDKAPYVVTKDISISSSTNAIIKCIKEINHTMLSTAQLRYRIKFGKYVEHYYCDYWDKISARTDMLGWTYTLMGDIKKSEKILFETIEELEEYSKNDNEMKNSDNFYNCYINLSRLHRHLAAAAPIRRKDFDAALKQVDLAMECITKLEKRKRAY